MIALNRRRVMGAEKQAKEYIQNGLVFWLDGIDKGGTEGYWIDLVGGLRFPLTGATSVADGVEFTAESDVKTENTTTMKWPLATYHLEVVCQSMNQTSLGTKVVVMPTANINVAFLFYNTSIGRSTYTGKLRNLNPKGNGVLANYSVAEHLQYCNGAAMSTINSTTNANGIDSYIHIGRKSAGQNYVGKICSVRVYSRQLTADEVIYNYNIDKERFGL